MPKTVEPTRPTPVLKPAFLTVDTDVMGLARVRELQEFWGRTVFIPSKPLVQRLLRDLEWFHERARDEDDERARDLRVDVANLETSLLDVETERDELRGRVTELENELHDRMDPEEK